VPGLTSLPDALVLAGGGTVGEAWMRGLLAGAEAASDLDFRECEYFVGTSAGSIVSAVLASGRRPEAGRQAEQAYAAAGDAAPDPVPKRFAGLAKLGAAVTAPLAPLVLAGTAPGGAAVRRAALAVPGRPARHSLGGLGRLIDGLGGRFDGRLRITAVDRGTGKRVVFGAPGAPKASVADAVLASCSIPWVFTPVEIGGREYVDGGVWSPANLDAVPARRGSEVLCLNPSGTAGPFKAVSTAATAREAHALRGRGVRVRVIVPDAAAAAAMGVNLMDRSRVNAVLDVAYAQGRRLTAPG
jgi:NTE family protein